MVTDHKCLQLLSKIATITTDLPVTELYNGFYGNRSNCNNVCMNETMKKVKQIVTIWAVT